MNTNTSLRSVPHKHAELIKAWADGATIEYREGEMYQWATVKKPSWRECTQYRIKPQPVIVKKYTFYDRIERYITNGEDLNKMVAQFWYDKPDPNGGMLEWTFTDGKLTSINILGEK
jgi:hypothetical protein